MALKHVGEALTMDQSTYLGDRRYTPHKETVFVLHSEISKRIILEYSKM